MSNGTCLLIGGNGFIGKNLTQILLSQQINVVVYDNTKPQFEFQNVKYLEGSIENTPHLISAASSMDYVVWLVHTSVPATSMNNVEFDLSSNIPPLIRFSQLLPSYSSIKKFIYLSSGGTVYGDKSIKAPIEEDSVKDPISSYGLTKLIAEEYLTFLLKRTPISTYILRPSNVYGRHQNLIKPQGIIGHIFKSILQRKSIDIYGDGSIIRDYIHVNDLSTAITLCLKTSNKTLFPNILNIGSGQETSINKIIDLISRITSLPVNINRMPERVFDCKFNVLSIEKVKKDIGWTPKVELQYGLEDVWEWIKLELNSFNE
jgi:UDP-glucose 4-epimerase